MRSTDKVSYDKNFIVAHPSYYEIYPSLDEAVEFAKDNASLDRPRYVYQLVDVVEVKDTKVTKVS